MPAEHTAPHRKQAEFEFAWVLFLGPLFGLPTGVHLANYLAFIHGLPTALAIPLPFIWTILFTAIPVVISDRITPDD